MIKTIILQFVFYQLVNCKPIRFYTITDNDRMSNYSYFTYNKFKDGKVKVIKNISVLPNELSSARYIKGKVFSTDDHSGRIYRLKKGSIETYDKTTNFYKSEAIYKSGKYLYIYNYTENKTIPRQYNIVKYDYKSKKVETVFNITNMINMFLQLNKYTTIDINAIDYYKGTYYVVPRFYKRGNQVIYNSDMYVITPTDQFIYTFSEPLPKEYGVTDMEVYKKKIYFVASRERTTAISKEFKSIFFITNLKGKLQTDYIEYDEYNKYEGITIEKPLKQQ